MRIKNLNRMDQYPAGFEGTVALASRIAMLREDIAWIRHIGFLPMVSMLGINDVYEYLDYLLNFMDAIDGKGDDVLRDHMEQPYFQLIHISIHKKLGHSDPQKYNEELMLKG